MTRMFRSWLLASGILLLTTGTSLSWGAAGHSIVAELAERRLTAHALSEIGSLLGGRKSLASLSSWADEVQTVRPATRNWHFVNIPFEAPGYDAERDCAARPGGDCIVKAIERMRTALADRTRPKPERLEALMFLVHLVADVHQPMHCVDRGDAGGTLVTVSFFGQTTSLHSVWDVGLIERRTFYWGEYVRLLESTLLPEKDYRELTGGTPADWANEAHRAAVSTAYALPESLELGEPYVAAARPVLDRQLVLAGLRLARVLNEVFAPPPSKRKVPRRRS